MPSSGPPRSRSGSPQYVVVVHSHLYFSPFDSLKLSPICEIVSVLIVHSPVASTVLLSQLALHSLVIVFIGLCSGYPFINWVVFGSWVSTQLIIGVGSC
jgi:hypothetical protein